MKVLVGNICKGNNFDEGVKFSLNTQSCNDNVY